MTSSVGAGTAHLSSWLLHFLSKYKENFPKNGKKATKEALNALMHSYLFSTLKKCIFVLYSIFRIPECKKKKKIIQLMRD